MTGTLPSTYTIRARTTGGGAAVADAAGTPIPFDAAWPTHASDPSLPAEQRALPGPAELLAASLGACLLKNLARCRELIGFQFDSAEVEVTARRQDVPPRFVEVVYDLRVVTSEDEHRINFVHSHLRTFGTIYNTLAAVCDVHGTITAVTR
jgi:uncharacterized OsmC-like protein